jgi:arylsulfatase A
MGTYGDFVMETDWAIGQIVQAIETAGVADNTLIIVTADNGCSPAALKTGSNKSITFRMGENEAEDSAAHYSSNIYRGHKADIYEGGHRVPYIARWDGNVKAGSLCNDPVCLVDLYATCADILGKKIPDTAAEDSVSILPDLLGTGKIPVREAIVHHSINGSFSIRQGNWKLNLCPGSGGWSNPRPKDIKAEEVQEWVQLFDLSDDPAETKNMAKENPETVERLTNLAQQYIDNGRSTPGANQENNGETHLYPSWIRKARP